MNTIINEDEARTLGRPIGKVSNDKICAFIQEVENTIIRKTLGDSLYMRLVNNTDITEELNTLLEGGTYDDNGEARFISGLKVAIAYYVYAQNVRAGDFESTRYGMVIKDGQYSSPISSKERDTAANSATEVANVYLKECVEYCKKKGIIKMEGRGNVHLTSSCIIRKIRI